MSIANTLSSSHPTCHRKRQWLRGAGAAGPAAALALASCLFGPAPASAQYYRAYYGGYGYIYGHPHRPRHAAAKHLGKDAAKQEKKDSFADMPKGPLQIVISIDQQKLHLYSDGTHVADTSIATGVPSLPTPLGVFSVIQKQVFHRSNLYSNAPMPFMQRITWSGVALHEGESIGHRASHGCIRMPHDFAVRLYHMTKLGVPVVIANKELKPVEFADAHLFVHRDKPPEPVPAAPADTNASPAAPTAAVSPAALGLRVADSPATAPTAVADAAKPVSQVSDAPQSAAASPQPAIGAIVAPSPDSKPNAAAPTPAPAIAPGAAALDPGVPAPPPAPPSLLKTAPVSKAPIAIFISRKEKKIYVRQDFAPLFQAPVTIADPDKPLGTHLFTALGFTGDDHATLRWDVVSLPPEPPPQPKRRAEREARHDRYGRDRREREETEKLADLPPPETPADALARIAIPQQAIDDISALMVPGSTLIVSDHGLGDETGEGTNFIVVTR